MGVKPEKLKTAEEARADLEAYGITLADLAEHLGVSDSAVKDVLSRKEGDPKKARGSFGSAHKVMVALGMKAAPPGQKALDLSKLSVSHRKPNRAQPAAKERRHAQAA